MKLLYRFDGIGTTGETCAACNFLTGAATWLLLEPSIDPDSFKAQNGVLCAECVLEDLIEQDSPWEVKTYESSRR